MGTFIGRLKEEDSKLLIELYLLLMLILLNLGFKKLSSHDRMIFFISFLLILCNSVILLAKFKILTKELLRDIVTTLFQICLIIFLLLLLASQFRNEIKEYINLNYFLAVVIILGIYVFLRSEKQEKRIEIKRSDYYFIFLCGIVGCLIVWYKLKNLGTLSYLISLLSGILIITLSFLLLEEEKSPEVEEKAPEVSISPEKPIRLPEEKHVEYVDIRKEELKKIEIEKIRVINRLWTKFVMKVDSFVTKVEGARPDDFFELYKTHRELLEFYKNFTSKFDEYIPQEERRQILKKFHHCSSILADLLDKL